VIHINRYDYLYIESLFKQFGLQNDTFWLFLSFFLLSSCNLGEGINGSPDDDNDGGGYYYGSPKPSYIDKLYLTKTDSLSTVIQF